VSNFSAFSQPARAASRAATIQAPIGGLNAYDSIANMPIQDAVLMDNMYPQPYGGLVRKGYQEWVTNITGTVESLLTWSGAAGSDKMWAMATSGIMYDVSTSTSTPAVQPISGLSNARWQFTNFANSAGSHMLAFNGADDGIWYNGSSYQRLVAGNGSDNATWANVDPRDLIHCCVHQRRVWAVEKNSMYGWYLPVNSVFGVAASFDFGPMFARGGYLMALASWSIDDGDGADDHLVAISSEGEVAVYSGTNPNDPAEWTLQGIYYVGAPIGRRCVTKLGGETILVTAQGVVALSESLASTKVNESRYINYSSKVQQLISDLTTQYGTNFGWEPFVYPPNNMLMINVPGAPGVDQLASNTILRSWCTFQGYDAQCFALMSDTMFFGADTKVYRAWYGNADGVLQNGTGGVPVEANVIQAFNYFESPGQQKHPKMFRPTFVSDGPYVLKAIPLFDFDLVSEPQTAGSPPASSSVWDSGLWDAGIWGGAQQVYRFWIQSRGIGMAVTARLRISTLYNTFWVSTDWLTESGGVL
jgi:hypothetical protein